MICSTCGKETNSLWREGGDKGDCNDCHTKKYFEEHPIPKIEGLKPSTQVKGYKKYNLFIIPSLCPYCNGEIESAVVGIDTERDIIYTQYTCEPCKVDFGYTD